MCKYFFSVFLICSLFQSVVAQLVQEPCLELEKARYGDYYFVVSGEEKGMLIFRETEDTNKSGTVWDLRALDTDLKEMWSSELTVDWKRIFRGYEYREGYLYLLFVEGNDYKSDMYVERFNIENGDTDTYKIENDMELELSHMIVSGDNLVLGGYIVNRPAVVFYNLPESRIKVLPGFFHKKSEIIELKANAPDTTFNILFSEKSYAGGNLLKMRTFGQSGNVLFEYDLKMDENYHLLGGKTSNINGDAVVITGTFGSLNSYYSQGLLFAKITKDGKATVKYHYFSELDNFFNYMHPRRTEKIKDKIIKNKAKGKRYEFRSRLLLNELVEDKDGYLILAEIYQPKFDYNQTTLNNDPYSLASVSANEIVSRKYVPQSSRVSNSSTEPNTYAYHQAVVMQLGKAGKVQWDESMKISGVQKTSLQQTVSLNKTNQHIELLYKSGDDLNFKTLNHGEVLHADTVQQIRLKNEEDTLKDHPYEELGNVTHWYGDYYFVWGYRRVARATTNAKENVFYINKVHIEEIR